MSQGKTPPLPMVPGNLGQTPAPMAATPRVRSASTNSGVSEVGSLIGGKGPSRARSVSDASSLSSMSDTSSWDYDDNSGVGGVHQADSGHQSDVSTQGQLEGDENPTTQSSRQASNTQAQPPQPQPKEDSMLDSLGKAAVVTAAVMGGAVYAAAAAVLVVGFFVATFPVGLIGAAVAGVVVGAVMLFDKLFRKKSQPVQEESPRDMSQQGKREQEQRGNGLGQQPDAARHDSARSAAAAVRSSVGSYAPGSASHSAHATPVRSGVDPTAPKMGARRS